MSIIVPRTCTEMTDEKAQQGRNSVSQPLARFRDTPAYVLLGDPGSGKTTAFKVESEATENGSLISACDFLDFYETRSHEWRDKTLFIDGLDEVLARTSDARTPFGEIRRRLDMLGKPRFRLSCRQADWLGKNDLTKLGAVSPNSNVTSLRLDPLTNSDVEKILMDWLGNVDDADEFIAKAGDRKIDGLLTNPQSLDLLVKAVTGGGSWPESRLETFGQACRQMVLEHNEEHQAARESSSIAVHTPTPEELLDAAGRLCAVQLLSGAAGYTFGLGQPSENYPAVDKCDGINPNLLRFTRSTKLFRGESNNRFAPVHRHIAEFLGARHLARLIEGGLPAQRVISLMTGEDGIVVTEMRGLSAWLAALCREARSALIERDPIGVGLYGDIRGFSHDEKRTLLDSLNRESYRLHSEEFIWKTRAAFGALVTPDMQAVLENVLNDHSREKKGQLFVDFVLNVLCHGIPLTDLADVLLEIVCDKTRWPRVRNSALDAFIYHCPDSPKKVEKLKTLLEDVRVGKVIDSDNELLGTLLDQLYPTDLSPSEVLHCLMERGDTELVGRYWRFWYDGILKKSSDRDVAELLHNLHRQLSTLKPILEDLFDLEELPQRLLARGLQTQGNFQEPKRLYDWLEVGLVRNRAGLGEDEQKAVRDIRLWLEQRPDMQKAIIIEGLSRCPNSDEFWLQALNVEELLYGANLPPDFGAWCQRQALGATDARVAEYFVWRAYRAGVSLKNQMKRAQRSPRLQNVIAKEIEKRNQVKNKEQERTRRDQSYQEAKNRQHEAWLNCVRSNKKALSQNRAAPSLLDQMARVYFGRFTNSSIEGGPKALAERLDGNKNLIDAVLQGFRGVVSRNDVPDIKEIFDLKEKNKRHYLSLPFLAGLAELERSLPKVVDRLNENQIRKAVAFYYCTPHGGYKPDWYSTVLATRPDIVADIQIEFAVSEFRCGRDHIYKLWELAHDAAYAEVARLATLPLLCAFPTRCKSKQLESLKSLLWAAVQSVDRPLLQGLIGKKMSRKSMNHAQRIYWLAAGTILSPEIYQDRLGNFVHGQESRIHHLVTFLSNDDPMRFSLDELRISIQELLIRLVGSYAGPYEMRAGGWETPTMQASRLVRDRIQYLAVSRQREASETLTALLADPSLSLWYEDLSQARDSQLVVHRDARYHHPDIAQVCKTLNGGTPANSGDLAAFVVDRLQEIAVQIRNGNTDGWKKYWNADHHKKPTEPRHEDICRDTLLDDLRPRLPQEVDVQREGQYANNKRSDIRIAYHNFHVPVEIKRNSHRDVWRAMRNQLIKQYTRDPETDGHGIYLVFWFGKKKTPLPPSGVRPVNPGDMKERLEATLSPDEARKISVCVVDVSRPEGSAAADESSP